jgi:hypothetical protein
VWIGGGVLEHGVVEDDDVLETRCLRGRRRGGMTSMGRATAGVLEHIKDGGVGQGGDM